MWVLLLTLLDEKRDMPATRSQKGRYTEVGTAAKVKAVATRQLNHHVLRGAAAGREVQEALCKSVLDSVDEAPTGEECVAASEAKEAED